MKRTKPSMKFDVFICYSQKDDNIVIELANKLKEDGLQVWIDKWQIEPTDIIELKISEGLQSSRNLIFIMSENSFKDDWLFLERQTIMFRELTNGQRKFIPIKIDKCKIKSTLKQYTYINYQRKSARAYSRLLSACRMSDNMKAGRMKKKPPQYNVHILKGHTELIRRVSISKDGKHAISASNDKTLRIWDLETKKCINILSGHEKSIWAASINDEGTFALSGSYDNSIRIWELQNGKCTRIIKDHRTITYDIDISLDNRYAVSSHDFGRILLWDLVERRILTTINAAPFSVWSIKISRDGNTVASGSQNNNIDLWDAKTGICIFTLIGHKGDIQGMAFTNDGTRLVSGSSDSTVRIWEVATGRCLATLEGHTDKVWSVSVTKDGNTIISGSSDHTIRVWDTMTGKCLNILSGHYESVYSLAVSEDGRRIVSAGKDKTVRVWDLIRNRKILPKDSNSIRYTNAKVLIVGDTGVGKSGLAIRLTENRFVPTISTDAVWATQLKLPYNYIENNNEREIWLWDFGGQQDYRLVHQLFMDETSLALFVFNPQDDNPFEGLIKWSFELQNAARRPFKKILVAGRCDRGRLIVSRDSLINFQNLNGFKGFFETSANTGEGCLELYEAIINGIEWDIIPWTSSPKIFKLLKRAIIELKDEGKVLLRFSELKQQIEMKFPNEHFTVEVLSAVIGLLAGPGVVWKLDFGDFILLKPEKINAYAAAVIRKVRQHTEEIGIIYEEDVLNGVLDYQDMKRLPSHEEQIVLFAMHQNFINHGICLREQTESGTLLVFPSYFKRESPVLQDHPPVFVTYSFSGNLDDIYSTLIVRLHHSSAFRKDKLWRFAADFKTEGGKKIGIKLTKQIEGTGEIAIYFDPVISDETKVTFIRYVHEHLSVKTIDIIRLRHYICPHCNTPVENRKTALDRLKEGKRDILCVCCEKRIPLWDLIEEKFSSESIIGKVNRLVNTASISMDNESKELILIGHVFSVAGEAGQIFRPTANSDWGTDGEIEFKTINGQASGKKLYLQLKSGDSYLTKRKSDNNEIFRLTKHRYLDYWKALSYPVMLVIRTSDGVTKWMNVTEYLQKRDNRIRQIVFKGEPFTAYNILKLRDKVLGF